MSSVCKHQDQWLRVLREDDFIPMLSKVENGFLDEI